MFRYLQSSKFISLLVSWIIILNCFSYPITAVFIAQLGVQSTPVNIALKLLYSFLAVFVLIVVFMKSKFKILKISVPIFFFYLIYSLRLFVDIQFREIIFISPFYIYSYFFGATLLPILVVIFCYKFINIDILTKYSFYTLLVADTLLLYYLLVLGGNGSLQEQLATRAHIQSEGNKEVHGTLINPIMIGYFGAILSLLSINLSLYNTKYKINKFLIISSILMGITLLFLGASRGPFLGFVLMLLISLLYFFYIKRHSIIVIIKSIGFGIFFLLVLYKPISDFVKNNNLTMFIRIEEFISKLDKGQKEYRDHAFESALNDFYDSPVIGKQYIGTFDNFYPHNVFLEVLMATGLLGGAFFALYFLNYIKSIYLVFKKSKLQSTIPFILASLVCFLLGLSSGGLFSSPDIWILMALTTIFPHKT